MSAIIIINPEDSDDARYEWVEPAAAGDEEE